MDHHSSVANIPPAISRDRGLNLNNLNRPINNNLDPFQAPRPVTPGEANDHQDYATLNTYQTAIY